MIYNKVRFLQIIIKYRIFPYDYIQRKYQFGVSMEIAYPQAITSSYFEVVDSIEGFVKENIYLFYYEQ